MIGNSYSESHSAVSFLDLAGVCEEPEVGQAS